MSPFPSQTKGGGMGMGFPDIVKTPLPPTPSELIPIPIEVLLDEDSEEWEIHWESYVKKVIEEDPNADADSVVNRFNVAVFENLNYDTQIKVLNLRVKKALQDNIQAEINRTKELLNGYIELLESQAELASAESELANLDLQNSMQKMSQLLTMMSNIMKQAHDNAMSIIRNLKG